MLRGRVLFVTASTLAGMQERVNLEGLMTRRACLQGWPSAGFWNGLQVVLCAWDSEFCCPACLDSYKQCDQWWVLTFLLRVWDFNDCGWSQRQSVSVLPVHSKNLGVLSGLTGQEHWTGAVTLCCWSKENVGSLCTISSRFHLMCLFPLQTAVINYSCECNWIWALWIFLESGWNCVCKDLKIEVLNYLL